MAERTFIIAEAGVNHNGSLDLALQLIDVAAQAGADAVKFQTFRSESVVTAQAAKAVYQVSNTQEGGNQLEMIRRLELSFADHAVLVAHCKLRGIHFMSTAFDTESLELLATLGMPALKLPSGDVTCGPLLLQSARLRMPMYMSTGMCSLADVEAALGVLAYGLTCSDEPSGKDDFDKAYNSAVGQAALGRHVTLLHCVTQYPAPLAAVNLRAMDTLAAAFGLPVGYSDHTLGIEVALAAVARGATVIEKHFTLDRQLPGPDHLASLEPAELIHLVSSIRHIEQALGSPIKRPADEEVPNLAVARRSLVAARPLAAGDVLDASAMAFKRPGTGISPMRYWDLIGCRASRAYDADDLLQP